MQQQWVVSHKQWPWVRVLEQHEHVLVSPSTISWSWMISMTKRFSQRWPTGACAQASTCVQQSTTLTTHKVFHCLAHELAYMHVGCHFRGKAIRAGVACHHGDTDTGCVRACAHHTLVSLNAPHATPRFAFRFRKDQIYTYVGDMLLAVNPYKSLGIYHEDAMARWAGHS
jgi:hypothetical protein